MIADLATYPGAPPETVLVASGPFQLTHTGVTLIRAPTFEEWTTAVGWVQGVEGVCQFWLGDLIAYGEATWGETYSQALEATAYAEKTLRNAVYVAKAIPPARRRPLDRVSFGHHAEVASLPPAEQDAWLAQVEADHLTREGLRGRIRAAKAAIAGTDPACWLVVRCANLAEAEALADRLRAEGHTVTHR